MLPKEAICDMEKKFNNIEYLREYKKQKYDRITLQLRIGESALIKQPPKKEERV